VNFETGRSDHDSLAHYVGGGGFRGCGIRDDFPGGGANYYLSRFAIIKTLHRDFAPIAGRRGRSRRPRAQAELSLRRSPARPFPGNGTRKILTISRIPLLAHRPAAP